MKMSDAIVVPLESRVRVRSCALYLCLDYILGDFNNLIVIWGGLQRKLTNEKTKPVICFPTVHLYLRF